MFLEAVSLRGQSRHMMRDRTIAGANPGWPGLPDYDSAVWTETWGDGPVDYTVEMDGTAATKNYVRSYNPGVSDYDWTSSEATYYHGDQIASTQAMTDDAGAVVMRPVYTAFGERVQADGRTNFRYTRHINRPHNRIPTLQFASILVSRFYAIDTIGLLSQKCLNSRAYSRL